MDITRRHNLSIGITYAVRHLEMILLVYKFRDPDTSSLHPSGDELEKRRVIIMTTLKAINLYLKIYAGTQISGDALVYIYRTDHLMERIIDPAKGWSRDGLSRRTVAAKLLDDMEHDLDAIKPEPIQLTPTMGQNYWTWDAGRKQWYHYDSADRTFKYHGGLWLRLDGSKTSHEKETELLKAHNLAAQRPQGCQDSDLSTTASLDPVPIDRVEEAGLQ